MFINDHSFINVDMPRTKRKTDDDVLDALLPAILITGVDRITLREMGAAAGLSPATLVQRFGSRIEVIEAALDRSTERLERELDEPLPDGMAPAAGLARWLADLTAPISDRALLVGSFQVLARDILITDRNQRARHHLGLVRRRISTGLTAMGCSPQAAHRQAVLVEAHWHGLVIQWAVHGEGELAEWVHDGLLRLLDQLNRD